MCSDLPVYGRLQHQQWMLRGRGGPLSDLWPLEKEASQPGQASGKSQGPGLYKRMSRWDTDYRYMCGSVWRNMPFLCNQVQDTQSSAHTWVEEVNCSRTNEWAGLALSEWLECVYVWDRYGTLCELQMYWVEILTHVDVRLVVMSRVCEHKLQRLCFKSISLLQHIRSHSAF